MKINYFLIWIFFAKAFNGILINTFVNGNLFIEPASKHKTIFYKKKIKKDKKNKKKIIYKKYNFCHTKKYTL